MDIRIKVTKDEIHKLITEHLIKLYPSFSEKRISLRTPSYGYDNWQVDITDIVESKTEPEVEINGNDDHS